MRSWYDQDTICVVSRLQGFSENEGPEAIAGVLL
jgi:hypothetical protein